MRGESTTRNREWIPLALGTLFLLLSVVMLVNPVHLLMHGKSVDGVVTEVVRRPDRDAKDREVVRSTATIRFRAGDMNMAIERSWSEEVRGFSRCFAGCYEKGEKLKVIYPVDDPQAAEVDTFFGLFGASLISGVSGVFCLLIWRLVRSPRRRVTEHGMNL